ncbi:S-adenosyl-L-methionine-dependent methyltransferase [Massarina eburnea CBS 473.64]|uniref:S-adenosyl-L-methionine-dependent methyltransferase n=1 Tax=Massarina eburnea CBS 473.64 TaxID=1395130 RepID=A0A6A6RL69_9PLEO|nr:S-adenosyl-L-methionine-dependent methyltransferase [Massarina eburnea CBS 473.64]
MASQSFLDQVFAAKSPEDSRRLYDQWATSYDTDMTAHDFTAPRIVAELAAKYLSNTPNSSVEILDAGCGSGAVGLELNKLGYRKIDGLDISQGMLDVARKLEVYRDLKIADLTKRLEAKDGAYGALVCCGTFTHGHVGKEPLEDFMRVVKSGGVLVATVLETFWDEGGFSDEVQRLKTNDMVEVLENEVHAYRKDAGGGKLLVLKKI